MSCFVAAATRHDIFCYAPSLCFILRHAAAITPLYADYAFVAAAFAAIIIAMIIDDAAAIALMLDYYADRCR